MLKLNDEQYEAMMDWVKDHQDHFLGFPMEFAWELPDGEDLIVGYDDMVSEMKLRGEKGVFDKQDYIDMVLEGKITYSQISLDGVIKSADARDVLMMQPEILAIQVSSLSELMKNPSAKKFVIAGEVFVTEVVSDNVIDLSLFEETIEGGISVFSHPDLSKKYEECQSGNAL